MSQPEKIIEFLRLLRPAGPWTLYAMEPDSNPRVQETKTFMGSEDGLVAQFIDKYIDRANLYFVINPTTQPVTVNPKKELISQVEYLHVDVDPDSTKDFKEERDRIYKSLMSRHNPPTVLIDSGGGFQALWKLETPVQIISTGETDNISEIEAYNRQLEREYAADHCHNINRLLRLPYTTNLPTEIKRKRGRIKAATDLVFFEAERVYKLTDFIRAEIVASNAPVGECDIIDFGGLAPVDIDELTTITPEMKSVIMTGNTPDGRYKGRSEAVLGVTRHMVKNGVSDTVIASILLDRTYKISEHIYDQRNPQEYTKRQISRAKTAENEKHGVILNEMNDKYCVCQEGSKTFIFSEEFDPELKHHYIKKQKWDDFQQFWAHRTVEIETDKGTKEVPLAKWWFTHKRSNRFHQVVFLPNQNVPGVYNLWRGLSCEPKQGDWSLFQHHIYTVICRNNDEYYDYLINWMARCVQKPEAQGHVAVVLRGPRGSGKTMFARQFGLIFGRHFLHVANPKHVTGNFNAHLRDCVLLLADEAFFAGDKHSESTLKTLITEERIPIEAKHVDVRQARNCIKMIMCSNQEWVVPAGEMERRFFVLDVSDPKSNQNTVYFDAMANQMDNGGREALLHFLMSRDISKFDVWKYPKTAALYEQQLLSAGPEATWWYEKLREGQAAPSQIDWSDQISARAVLEDYQDKATLMGHRYKKINLDQFFRKVLPTKQAPERVRRAVARFDEYENKSVTTMETFYVFPSLNDCRAAFEKFLGIEKIAWPEMPGEVTAPQESIPF